MAAINDDVLFVFEYVDNNGDPYDPSPAPTVAVRRYNASNGSGETLVSAQASIDSTITGRFTYILDAAENDALGVLEAVGVTTDTNILAILRTAYASVDVEPAVSVDLTTIEADLDTLLNAIAGGVTSTAPVAPETLTLTIVRGDDYTTDSGRTLPEWTSDGWTPYDLSAAASVTFKAKTRYGTTVFSKAMAVLSDTQVRLQLTDTETAAFDVGREAYNYDVEAVLSVAKGSDIITLAQGKFTVLPDVR